MLRILWYITFSQIASIGVYGRIYMYYRGICNFIAYVLRCFHRVARKAYILHSPVPALTTEGACRVLAEEWGAASEQNPGWLQAG
jgi:hypothetical protein